MTSQYAVLGSPISHSLSPVIHDFIHSRLGRDASYHRFEVSENLGDFLQSKGDYLGFSLTMPLKDAAFKLAQSLSAAALATESVNTLVRTAGGLAGFNTDVFGIVSAVKTAPPVVAVIGSGATARSALHAFPNAAKFIASRNAATAGSLAKKYGAEVVDFRKAMEADVVISTLPAGALGMLLPAGFRFKTLLDVAYANPMIRAETYVSGLEMLIQQAIAQQRIFTNEDENIPLETEDELLMGLRVLLNVPK